MKQEVATLTVTDLQSAGINSQLSSNDLVEVVAHDIYDKYLDAVDEVIKKGKVLEAKYSKLMDAEINKMKSTLSKYFKKDETITIVEDDDYTDEEFEGISASFSTGEQYWPSIDLSTLSVREKEKGTFVEYSNTRLSMPPLKDKTAKIKITLQTGKKSDTEEIKTGNITGEIQTSIQKTFKQVITIPLTRFKVLSEEVIEYNKEVSAILNFLPKNGALSVERFTREARVKMNKKIISAQSPEFRKKISELFNIKL